MNYPRYSFLPRVPCTSAVVAGLFLAATGTAAVGESVVSGKSYSGQHERQAQLRDDGAAAFNGYYESGVGSDKGPGQLDLELGFEIERYPNAHIRQLRGRHGELPRATVELNFEPSWAPAWEWSWYVQNPSNNQLASDLTIEWHGQASCPEELTSLRIDGPGGLAVQNPLSNPISGTFNYQSFDVERVKNICLDWAEQNNCDPSIPGEGCATQETFVLYSDVAAQPDDLIKLEGSCASGPIPTTFYEPAIEILCLR